MSDRKIVEYKLVLVNGEQTKDGWVPYKDEDQCDDIVVAVNRQIKLGWEPFGSLSSHGLSQPMVRYDSGYDADYSLLKMCE